MSQQGQQVKLAREDIAGIECRFAVFCRDQFGSDHDLHMVKENIHLKDGTTVPHLRYLRDFERPFWITKPGFRDHKDKKEEEDVSKLLEFKSTQSQLNRNIARALGNPGFRGSYKQLSNSPFLYGADIPSVSVIKRKYQNNFPDLNTQYSVAAFDTEKDMVHGTDEINMATVSYKGRVYTAVQRFFVEGHADVINRLQEKFKYYLGDFTNSNGESVDFIKKRGLQWEVEIVDSEVDVIRRCMQKAHEWKPDFMTVWNIDFDMPLMLHALEKKGVDPADIFCDPSVPRNFKFFKYAPGPTQFVSASGKVKPLKNHERWNTVHCPSSFYWIDGMCAYKLIRIADGEEPSYALDAILDKKLGIRKLKFKEADHLHKAEWHMFMQSNYPLEYVIYNVFDCISMEELDETTLDLSLQVPSMAGCADFAKFKSKPTRLVSELHYFLLEKNKVIGTAGDSLKTPLDDLTIANSEWIITLPAHLVADNGLCIIEEDPTLRTNIRIQVADLDVSASYPNGGSVFNICKRTTWRELCSIEGVSELERRRQGINLSGGPVNAIEVAVGLFNCAELTAWEAQLAKDLAAETPALPPPETNQILVPPNLTSMEVMTV
jgi:hypothetical protein